jgi:hypothetical protein
VKATLKKTFGNRDLDPSKEVFKPAIRHVKANFLAKQAEEWKKEPGARMVIQGVEESMREAWSQIFGKNHSISLQCLSVSIIETAAQVILRLISFDLAERNRR